MDECFKLKYNFDLADLKKPEVEYVQLPADAKVYQIFSMYIIVFNFFFIHSKCFITFP
jgi:hypothetical protein